MSPLQTARYAPALSTLRPQRLAAGDLLDVGGKSVAVFGCGDSGSYGDNFCDGIEELHATFEAAGAKLIGYVDSSPYTHSESKSEKAGQFLGCPFDEDNESDQSEERAAAWVAQLKKEGMPL